jgi:replicative DNA helicase
MASKLPPPEKASDAASKAPQDLRAERSLLGSIILQNEAIDDAILVVRPEDFYLDTHRTIYEIILRLHEQRVPFDAVTICDALVKAGKSTELVSEDVILEIFESVPHGAHARHYAEIVAQKAGYRSIIHCATDSIRDAYRQMATCGEVASDMADAMLKIVETGTRNDVHSISELLHHACARFDKKADFGVPTGISEFDAMTQGLQPGNLLILAARPSMGKTAFVIDLIMRIAEEGSPVLFFSLEQSGDEVADRVLSRETNIPTCDLRRPTGLTEFHYDTIMRASARIDALEIYVDDGQSPTITAIEAITRIWKRRKGIKAVFIDYLQLIEPEDRRMPREQQVSGITRRLKRLARVMQLPIVCLAQLNRDLEKRENKRPILPDLRESGSIEQDADLVVFLHRPEYFDPDDRPGIAEIILAKHRNGPKGRVDLRFDLRTMSFSELTIADKLDPQLAIAFDETQSSNAGF